MMADVIKATSHKNCKRHRSPLASKCNASTQLGYPCSRAPKCFPKNRLPTCRQHAMYTSIPAGECQALESCGHPCLKMAPLNPPFNLCAKHANGTDTLPCYLLEMPTELRLMTFRYLFPKRIPAGAVPRGKPWKQRLPDIHSSILRVNHQINEEASLVLYGESVFHAMIESDSIFFLGREWTRPPSHKRGEVGFDIAKTFPSATAMQIERLKIDVTLDDRVCSNFGDTWSADTYSVFGARDSVRKFTKLISAGRCRELEVTPRILKSFSWEVDEIVAASRLVLGPFTSLFNIRQPRLASALVRRIIPVGPRASADHNRFGVFEEMSIENVESYKVYQVEWQDQLMRPINNIPLNESKRKYLEKKRLCYPLLTGIEDFVGLMYEQDSSNAGPKKGRHIWTESTYEGIGRVMRRAQAAFEEGDDWILKNIKRAIEDRWINYHRQHHNNSSSLAEALGAVSDPVVFNFEARQSIKAFSYYWPEVKIQDKPSRDAEDVTIDEDEERLYIYRGDQFWVHLKTPAMVRMARSISKKEG